MIWAALYEVDINRGRKVGEKWGQGLEEMPFKVMSSLKTPQLQGLTCVL